MECSEGLDAFRFFFKQQLVVVYMNASRPSEYSPGLLCLKKNLNAPRLSELLFPTFSVLVAKPKKILYTVANPACVVC